MFSSKMFEDKSSHFLAMPVFCYLCSGPFFSGEGAEIQSTVDPALQPFGHWVSALQSGLIPKRLSASGRILSRQNIYLNKALLKMVFRGLVVQ